MKKGDGVGDGDVDAMGMVMRKGDEVGDGDVDAMGMG